MKSPLLAMEAILARQLKSRAAGGKQQISRVSPAPFRHRLTGTLRRSKKSIITPGEQTLVQKMITFVIGRREILIMTVSDDAMPLLFLSLKN
ncbi:hypothetical protein [Klebsiella sp. BIGb0407]|uniref:hypothetical protein n=1 Tax=Klebsiella sp. BIGb0407 TaxID=2940603 RepID=UPI002169C118|nr:hypothetical protein [Klebsiella sp. BIGb0407]MCS3429586.1 hypothetical protein [Klebsiella sp. BIGb0407]